MSSEWQGWSSPVEQVRCEPSSAGERAPNLRDMKNV